MPLFLKNVCLFIYFERERAQAGEGQIENPSRLHTFSAEPDSGLDPTNYEIMTQAQIKNQILN